MTPTTLHAAMNRLGLSQTALAALLRVDRVTVNRWCVGARATPEWAAVRLEIWERFPEVLAWETRK